VTALANDPLAGSEKYRAIRELGRGGMGQVFLAEHVALGAKVVVKLLHAELADKTTLVDRLRLEAQACARLNHPNIVRVTDFDRTRDGRPFFVMEYLPGRSLRDEVDARGGFLTVADAIDVVRQALLGLGAAHAVGLVHRDIKLDNLFLCDPMPNAPRLVKILDFGVAKVVDGASDAPAPLMVPTGTGVVVGTPRFFAPEQARGKPLDHRADIYAMGLVLYTLVSGRGPFDEATNITEMAKAHVFKQPEPPSRYAKQPVPDQLDAIVLRAIAKLPEQRFQSAAEFAAMLDRVVAAAAPPASAPRPEPQPAGLARTAYMAPDEPAQRSVQPPSAQPPSAQPPSAQPPSAQPPSAQPPSAQLPSAQPPSAQLPSAQLPSAQPPSAQPPSAPSAQQSHATPATERIAPIHGVAPATAPAPYPPAAPAAMPPAAPAAMPPVAMPPAMAPAMPPYAPPPPLQPSAIEAPPRRYSPLLAAAIVLIAGVLGAVAAAMALRLL
jgi:serine/threonine-protein kinase